ncbi:mannitol dehydrogenase family protein [Actinacidiphila alni]|uniref:mannitol dehydrogenase family protein n=1 Tax=Actinacidiphila alni TaxID=380248 RepID=UPI0033F6AC76
MSRLALAALPRLAGRPGLVLPRYAVGELGVGIVHLGAGAFHRAHQALFTEDSLWGADSSGGGPSGGRPGAGPSGGDLSSGGARFDGGWGICAFTQRSDDVLRALGPQDGLYCVLERGAGAGPVRVVGTLREIRSGPHDRLGPAARIADPRIRLVTLTVTEKGYRRGPDGRLDLTDPAVRADVAGLGALLRGPDAAAYRPRTTVGQLVAAMAERRRRDAGPLAVLPCDNLPGGGRMLRGLLHDLCGQLPYGDGLSDWIDTHVSFPGAVVDRIVPAATDADRAEAARLLGIRDAGCVVAEPYRQWVIEDDFAAGRPHWERAGAVLTADVRPYEAAKLRLLNAAHSLLAHAGALAGHRTIAAAMADDGLARAAAGLMEEDASPTLNVPDGFDLPAYRARALRRFADPALGHTTAQVATDGSVKLPLRLLGTVRDRLAAGAEPYWASYAVAAWMVHVGRRTDHQGRPLPVDDPRADELARAAGDFADAGQLVDRLLGVRAVFPAELAAHQVFRALLTEHAARLLDSGARAAP